MNTFMRMRGPSALSLALILLSGCATSSHIGSREDVLSQISTYDALATGHYDGIAPVKSLRGRGDFGIGTVDRWNGEVILLDGKYSLVDARGKVEPITDFNVTTPFLAVTWFHERTRNPLAAGTTYEQLRQAPERFLPNTNLVYAIKLEGVFHHVKARSMVAQSKPYKLMAELIKTQPTFEFQEVAGTIIGFWTPAAMQGIGLRGWHLHFLTKDGQGGGHVLEVTTDNAVLKLDPKVEVDWRMPGVSTDPNAALR